MPITYAFDGVTQGLKRAEAEILCDWLFTRPNLDCFALGGEIRRALQAGTPLELTSSDVLPLRAVLHRAEVGAFRGLAAIALAVGAEPIQDAA